MSNDLLVISRKGNYRREYPEPVPDTAAEAEWVLDLEMPVLQEILWEGVATTYDKCRVEPDGECPHGYKSPLLLLGMI